MIKLNIEGVTKKFTNHLALENVSISVPEGSIYGLLGPNGAGKTTLLRIINHITAPDTGKVYYNGKEIQSDDMLKIGYLPEERGLYKKMKVSDQVLYFAQLRGIPHKEAIIRLKEWLNKFEIENWWNKRIEELSKGMAQKLQFIVTVIHKPDLLILDEPFSGLDPINANLFKKIILDLSNEGQTIILSTHDMSSVEELCDNITLINRSRNILSGNVEEIKKGYSTGVFEVCLRSCLKIE